MTTEARSLVPAIAVLAQVLVAGCQTTKTDSSGFKTGGSGIFAPKGAPWTILCMQAQGPNREQIVNQLAETLRRTPGIRADDVVTFAHDGRYGLYYGTYFRRTDSKTGKQSIPDRLREDLTLVKELATPDGQHFFALARTVRVPLADVGPKPWRLRETDAAYSLQVAVFEPTDDFWNFKQAAADYCALLRDKGYEAYFHHGVGASMVTVGLFPESAVVIPERGLPQQDRKVTELQQDEWLRYNRLNGRVYQATGDDGRQVKVRSRLVEVPRDERPWLP